ncbi:MAG: c-type cytochrome biogenesis protein CcsB [bacterium]
MAVNDSMAHLSDALFTTAIATYSVALVGYCAEYAFGRRGRIARTSTVVVTAEPVRVSAASAPQRTRVLTTAGGPAGLDSSFDDSPARAVPSPSTRSSRRGWAEQAGAGAVAVTVVGFVIHLSSIVLRGTAVDRVPWGNMYEFSMVVGLIAVAAWLAVLARMPELRYLGVFVLVPVVVVMFLAGNVLYAQASPLVPALQSYWLAIHVSAAASGEGMLMTSAVLAGLYLIKMRYTATVAAGRPARFPVSVGERLPSAQSLDKASYRIVAFAFPIFTFGVICGAIWAEAAWGRYWGWDPKETWAFISWVVYAAYLHARATAGWKGRGAAWINLAGFAAMTFNFFVVNMVVSGLHSYAGLN